MMQSRREWLTKVARAGVAAGAAGSWASGEQPDFGSYTDEQKETFLRTAKIVSVAEIGHGVTKPVKVELALGEVKHSAKIQVVSKELPDFFAEDGTRVAAVDSWRFNVAAFKVDRLLGLKMATVAVPRTYRGKPAGFSWWVDDVMFEEVERIKKGIEPPNVKDFEQQMAVAKVFDELVINTDRNLSNLLITKSWKVALIDHSRCFTAYSGIRNKANLTRCSRRLLEGMKGLEAGAVTKAVGSMLTPAELKALLSRRDRIVEFFAGLAKEKGEENVIFS